MGKNKYIPNLRRKSGGNRIFKKKYFRGNQFSSVSLLSNANSLTSQLETRVPNQSESSSILTSTSSKKLLQCSINSNVQINNSNELPSCFILIDTDILKSIIILIGHCPQCHNNSIKISTDLSKKKGLAVCLNISCITPLCDWNQSFYSSKEIEKQGAGNLPYEINYRTVVAMREIGKGHSSLEKFCGLMNLPPPMNIKAFNDIQDKMHIVYQRIADVKMKNAADEFRYQQNDNDINAVADVVVSCDGTWQKRGHSSLNGVVTVIASDSGKCIDYRVLSKVCNACTSWESRKDSDAELYENFLETHDCLNNHEGSAGSMEVSGIVDCFMKSIDKRGLRYTHYIGDGDSKAHAEVLKNDPYPGLIVEKLECVGHVQKRVGNRLRKLKSTDKTKLADGKTLEGKGRLTDKSINKLQNYYGIAVRKSTGSTVYQMKKAIGAVLFHCSDALNLESRHYMCPRTIDSWCKYQCDKINNTKTYKENPGIPIVIRDKIKTIFLDLSDDKLLSRCLHGKTQNSNESINAVIWKRCPKEVFVGRITLEISVASAVIAFNDGISGILDVFEYLNISPGSFATQYCTKTDKARIKMMEKKSLDKQKQRRKHLRAQRKGFTDTLNESEGISYEPPYEAGLF